eukprot:COSAG01_NODE_4071_length_5382_cov_14.157676_5_plen_81_part_00
MTLRQRALAKGVPRSQLHALHNALAPHEAMPAALSQSAAEQWAREFAVRSEAAAARERAAIVGLVLDAHPYVAAEAAPPR